MSTFVTFYSTNHPLNLSINHKFHYALSLASLNWILEYSTVECKKVIEPACLKYFEPMLVFYVLIFSISAAYGMMMVSLQESVSSDVSIHYHCAVFNNKIDHIFVSFSDVVILPASANLKQKQWYFKILSRWYCQYFPLSLHIFSLYILFPWSTIEGTEYKWVASSQNWRKGIEELTTEWRLDWAWIISISITVWTGFSVCDLRKSPATSF